MSPPGNDERRLSDELRTASNVEVDGDDQVSISPYPAQTPIHKMAALGASWYVGRDEAALAEMLRTLIAERHEAYTAGRLDERHAIRQASNAVSGALDWKNEAQILDEVARARAYRQRMLDSRPRAGDYDGGAA